MDLLLGVALAAQIENVDKYPTITPHLAVEMYGASAGINYDAQDEFSYFGAYTYDYNKISLYGKVTYDDDWTPAIGVGYALTENLTANIQLDINDDIDTLEKVVDNVYVGIKITDDILSF